MVIKLFRTLLVIISKERFVPAAERLMRGRVADLGQVEPGVAVFGLLVLQGALQFIMVDRFEGLAVVKRGVACGFQFLDDPRVDLLVEQFAVVLLERVIDALQLRSLPHRRLSNRI